MDKSAGRTGSRSQRTSKAKPRQRNLLKRAFYHTVRLSSRLLSVSIFELRCYGRENTEVEGGAMILSSHQSNFDPVLIGVTFNEPLNYLARRTLFKNRIFGTIISLLDAIELDRDRSGLAGLKETIQRLRQGQKVLVFPEGTRTSDGEIAPLKPGFLAVARRSGVPLIPVAITGAYEALPRGSRCPVRYPLRVAVGPAIRADEFANLDDQAMLDLVKSRLDSCYRQAQESRH
ncbi:MAG: 1-acyl-sn-glycerol-3-phosphate acyltransferase [Planctomycetales bacterium]|nr:1-acyl-sn-glycerol-3-phosphate acyltransferase [Planctomycetales bacterium]